MIECLALADLKSQAINYNAIFHTHLGKSFPPPDPYFPTCRHSNYAERSISKQWELAKDISRLQLVPVELLIDVHKEGILNSEPPLPHQVKELIYPEIELSLRSVETNTAHSSVDEPTEVEHKNVPPHLEYAILESDNKLPVKIAKV
ncbi:hypothetical protein Tco_1410596 [Tanacetum coccineum]